MRTIGTEYDSGRERQGADQLTASSSDDLLLRALKKMSGRTMALAAEGGVVMVSDRQGKAIGRSSEIDAATWDLLETRGYVVREQDGSWRLSNAGRIQLKRLMSRNGRPRDAPAGATQKLESTCMRPAVDRSNLAESPLAWLRQRRDKSGRPLISQAQFEAGERLRSDFERGSMMARVTVNWSGTVVPAPDRLRTANWSCVRMLLRRASASVPLWQRWDRNSPGS